MALFLSLVACGGGGGRACATDSECPAGAACSSNGRCSAIECMVDRGCPKGAICEGARCTPGCRNELDCPLGAPICERSDSGPGDCIACKTTIDCKAGYECVDRVCKQPCRDDGNCDTRHCDSETRWCVECLQNDHCARGNVCADHGCAAGCDSDADCPAKPGRCLADRGPHGTCVECLSDADCSAGVCAADGVCEGAKTGSLDLLFVIDNSSSMKEEQDKIANPAVLDGFVAKLEAKLGHRPDLHVGVVSTDIGAGGYDCNGNGDSGRLLVEACARPPTGARFLFDIAGPAGRVGNYNEPTIGQAFSCIAKLGEQGCGWEQPLAAMRRALDGSVSDNAGFLRPEAALAVVILSNEDDCSAYNPKLFDSVDTSLGEHVSFRCFQHGVRCDPDDASALGSKQGCAPRDDSAYVSTIASSVDFLRARKLRGHLAVAVIAGPTTPVKVAKGGPALPPEARVLEPSCTSADGSTAVPAIRLSSFAAAFGASGTTASACEDYAPAMTRFADIVAGMLK